MKIIEACVGKFDTGRVKHIAEAVERDGGIVDGPYELVPRVKERKPDQVILMGEMLDRCVFIAADKLLTETWVPQVTIDLNRSRSYGIPGLPNDTDAPDPEELKQRHAAIAGRLWKHRENPRLTFIPHPSTFGGKIW